MKESNDATLVGPCGIYCGDCGAYRVKDNPSAAETLRKLKPDWDGVPCPGCRQARGDCQFIDGICETYACASGRGHDFCFECSEFPCAKLNPAADRAGILPHNLKVFNLCTIKYQGLETFIKRNADIKGRYYRGKMVIGKGPQTE